MQHVAIFNYSLYTFVSFVWLYILFYVCYDNHCVINEEALDVKVGVKVAVERQEIMKVKEIEIQDMKKQKRGCCLLVSHFIVIFNIIGVTMYYTLLHCVVLYRRKGGGRRW